MTHSNSLAGEIKPKEIHGALYTAYPRTAATDRLICAYYSTGEAAFQEDFFAFDMKHSNCTWNVRDQVWGQSRGFQQTMPALDSLMVVI